MSKIKFQIKSKVQMLRTFCILGFDLHLTFEIWTLKLIS